MNGETLRIVSVSLGSSKRDKVVKSELMGIPLSLERIGADGKFYRAVELIKQLAPEVQAIGLGGIDLYLYSGNRRHTVRDALKLKRAAGSTPVADGSMLKRILEPEQMDYLIHERADIPIKGRRILMVSGVDRTGMARVLAAAAGEIIFGDMIFALGIPIPVRSYKGLARLGDTLLPIITKLPFQVLYPTGEKQESTKPKHRKWLEWADVIAGDFHFIRRNIPPSLANKVVITNTTTDEDRQLLVERGLSWLITTTPVIDGRSFGMNVLEGSILALMHHFGDYPNEANFRVYLNKLQIRPTISDLRKPAENAAGG
jgi:hypothetical protein